MTPTRYGRDDPLASGPIPLQYGLAAGVDMPLHAGAAGKAILAHLPEATIGDLKLERFTERTITTKTELAEQPRNPGISVSYFIDGTVAGSITATVPRFRATHRHRQNRHRTHPGRATITQLRSIPNATRGRPVLRFASEQEQVTEAAEKGQDSQ